MVYTMTDEDVIHAVRTHFEGLFPKVCQSCGQQYTNLRDYILKTERVGPAISYDAEIGDWQPADPLGTLVAANCTCGSSLALSTDGMPLARLHASLGWLKRESERRGETVEHILKRLREEIRRQVLAPSPG
jgi:hypothetical protein